MPPKIDLDYYHVARKPVVRMNKTPDESEIIKRIGGLDKTKGSCSSLALAYAANKGGWEVTDYRGGESCNIFSKRSTVLSITGINGVKSFIERNTSDFKGAHTVLGKSEIGKEYYFACGRHAAVIRRLAQNDFQYLELQDDGKSNGFKHLDDSVLKWRFSAKKSHTRSGIKIEPPTILIDIRTLETNNIFINLMEYINTDKTTQIKGVGGGVK